MLLPPSILLRQWAVMESVHAYLSIVLPHCMSPFITSFVFLCVHQGYQLNGTTIALFLFSSSGTFLIKNYRPISLLCSVSKVLECLVYDKIVNFVTQSISLSYFGFLHGKSSLQLLPLSHEKLFGNLKNRQQSDVIYLDFCKTFDSVSHNELLTKIWSIDIAGNFGVGSRLVPTLPSTVCHH